MLKNMPNTKRTVKMETGNLCIMPPGHFWVFNGQKIKQEDFAILCKKAKLQNFKYKKD